MNWHISTYGEVKTEPRRHRGVAFKKQQQKNKTKTVMTAQKEKQRQMRRWTGGEH